MKNRIILTGLIVVGMFANFWLGYWRGWTEHKISFEVSLVEEGYGEYYLDKEHNKRFRMKETKK